MREEMEIIKDYLSCREKVLYKYEMGYDISANEFKTLEALRKKALDAKKILKEERKEIKKILKRIK